MRTRARNLRKKRFPAQNRLWYFLRNRRFCKYKFVREVIIGPYIADFVCRNQKLIIEVDGGQHGFEKAVDYDAKRTQYLENQGYRVLRFWNNEVFLNIENVLEEIFLWLG